MIYLDNAATSFPKPRCVIEALNKCVKEYCGNPGRSAHSLSLKSSEKIYETRAKIASYLNYSTPENVVFTLNASYALNLAIKTSVKENSHVLISDIEHNSVIRPLTALKKHGVEYSVFSALQKDEKDIDCLIRDNTTCIVASLVSNVTGEENSLKQLYKLKQKYNLKLIVDASQSIGHKAIDLSMYPVDVLCAPSHKALFGIQGAGFCIFCDNTERESFIEGGSGSESMNPLMPSALPEHFEAGTLPTPAIASLFAGLEFLEELGADEIERKLNSLTEEAKARLSSLSDVKILGANSGIISFTHEKLPPSIIAERLNSYGIAVRSGFHCAPLIHKRIGTESGGTVRVSFSYLNKTRELDKLYKCLKSELFIA